MIADQKLIVDEALWYDFVAFSRAQIESGDIDPTYPVLRERYQLDGLDPRSEEAIWRTFLYVAVYHLGSAEQLWERFPLPGRIPEDTVLPTGIERRGMRAPGPLAEHVNAAVRRGFTGRRWSEMAGLAGWSAARDLMADLPRGGAWSGYKWADLVKHVHGAPIEAPDLGVGGGSETAGPIPGLVRLTGRPWKICAGDVGLQRAVLARGRVDGAPFAGLDQLETCLCDFNSLVKGTYYTGNDIDVQLANVRALPSWETWREARRRSFPDWTLGEVHGWDGPRKALRTLYRDRHELVTCAS